MEVHICGGCTPADVFMLQAWEAEPKALLQPYTAADGPRALKCTNFWVKPHTDKTRPWTTSRLEFYGELDKDSKIEAVEPQPAWLTYHPLTPMEDLQHVPDGHLVCLPGRVLPPGVVKTKQKVDEEMVPLAKFPIRHGADLISMTAWRDLMSVVENLQPGGIHMFEAIKKVTKRGEKTNIELRYIIITRHTSCPRDLEKQIDANSAGTSKRGALVEPRSRRPRGSE